MMYTTQGLMVGTDLADHHQLHDTGPHPDCPGHYGDTFEGRVYCSVNEECPEAGQEEENPDGHLDA